MIIRSTLRKLEQSTEEPIDLDTVKRVLRFGPTSEDVLIQGWISAARQYFEDQTGRQILAATYELALDSLPTSGVIELPRPPLLDVTDFAYDSDGDALTFASAGYVVSPGGVGSPPTVSDPFAPRGRLELVSGGSWPTITTQAHVTRIQFVAGYGYTPDEVPEIVKSVLYDLVRHFHSRPDGDLPMTTQTMLRMFRQSAIGTVPLERDVVTW